jgi:ATP-dependent Clp protease ATP-binding subunit ClpA
LQSCELEAKRVISHFEMIRLAEPSREMMGEILAGAKCILEAEHSVEIDDDALAAALEAPCRSSESLPGRALELLECACLSQRLLAARGSRICINATDIENLSKTHLTRRP